MQRFITVYGTNLRPAPDLALYRLVDPILVDWPIDIYNHGDVYQDFTYVDNLARGIRLLIDFVVPRIAHSHGLADPLLIFSTEPTGVACPP